MRSDRMLAINHTLPIRILTWLPTVPALANAGSAWFDNSVSVSASSSTRLDDPVISNTLPIGWGEKLFGPLPVSAEGSA